MEPLSAKMSHWEPCMISTRQVHLIESGLQGHGQHYQLGGEVCGPYSQPLQGDVRAHKLHFSKLKTSHKSELTLGKYYGTIVDTEQNIANFLQK